MKKKERELVDFNEIFKIILSGKYATIGLSRGSEPYVVTLSYGYDKELNTLYFHSALTGLKLEFLSENHQVCGTIIEDLGYKVNECSHAYRSVVFWGEMNTIEDMDEKKHEFEVLIDHLEEEPEKMKKRLLKKDTIYANTCLMKIKIRELTGKASV